MQTASIILASGSPRRKELLSTFEIPFDTMVSGLDEAVPQPMVPDAMVQFLAQAKAKAVASSLQSGLVIGSDSTIAFRHVILGKPRDNSDAEQTLSMLRGEWHDVLSGVAVVDADTGRCVVSSVSTKIKMRAYSDEELRAYVETGEPLDKAGSYAIQGLGGRLVETLDGCFNNVVGLPLCELAKLLSGFGISPPIQSPVCLLPDGRPCPRLRIP